MISCTEFIFAYSELFKYLEELGGDKEVAAILLHSQHHRGVVQQDAAHTHLLEALGGVLTAVHHQVGQRVIQHATGAQGIPLQIAATVVAHDEKVQQHLGAQTRRQFVHIKGLGAGLIVHHTDKDRAVKAAEQIHAIHRAAHLHATCPGGQTQRHHALGVLLLLRVDAQFKVHRHNAALAQLHQGVPQHIAGGTLYVGDAEVNLYSGTLKYKQVDNTSYYGTGKGGVVAIYKGAFNLYGGTVEGTNMRISTYPDWNAEAVDNGSGGAIYMYGSTTLNVYGGHIKTGSAAEGKPGPCVYVHQVSCSVNLSGDGIVDNIYFRYNPQEKFAVTGTYIGSASVTFPDTLTISENMVIGTAAEADMSRGSITCTNGKGYYVPAQDGKLIISAYPNGTVAANGDATYASVQDAVDAYTGGFNLQIAWSTAYAAGKSAAESLW